jgi:uncharacterized membrane protein
MLLDQSTGRPPAAWAWRYLQLLTEATARYVLRRLNLPITNLIYSGGGNFYLLAGPTDVPVLCAIDGDQLYADAAASVAFSMAVAETYSDGCRLFWRENSRCLAGCMGNWDWPSNAGLRICRQKNCIDLCRAQGEGGGRERLC